MKKIVAITGVTGAMGSEVLAQLVLSSSDISLRCLVFEKEKKITPYVKKIINKNKDKVSYFFGDIANKEDCAKLLDGADYLIHMGACIPPKSDHSEKQTYESNFLGTKNLVDCIIEQGNKTKMVNIATVALYGNRAYPHNWGRIGDPIISSDYDNYSMNKMRAEKYVLESGLNSFVSLRQTGILHKYMFANNLKDGLMFHTCWNCCLEWTTDLESGLMCRHLIEYDIEGKLDGFWQRIYNIGGGYESRKMGYETVNDGFVLLGKTAKQFFSPEWNISRNFHGTWYTDSDELENFLHFRFETFSDYWKRMGKKYWYFKLGKPMPAKVISSLVFKPLFKNTNAPMYWVKNKKDGRVKAFYGGYDAFDKIERNWDKFELLCERADEKEFRTVEYAKKNNLLLNHGYDDSKKDSEITLDDLRSAALFRGGKCNEESFQTGDVYKKVSWTCGCCGKEFSMTPYTVLRGGYWCEECTQPKPWKYGKISQVSPYYAQVYYDTHSKEEENDVYPMPDDDEQFIEYKKLY